jgi:serine/threonine protein kinase
VADKAIRGGWRQAIFEGSPRFTREARVGRAGVAQIHQAFDRASGEDVAIKSVEGSVGASALGNAFEILRSLSHPGVIRVHDLFEGDDETALCMKWIEGADLVSFLRRADPSRPGSEVAAPGPPPDLGRLRRSFASLVATLRDLHEGGIVHRDVKPAHVLASPSSRVVLHGFELAFSIHAAPRKDSGLVGTPLYMVPDHMRLPATPRPMWDLYAVGVMLHQVLTGSLPWETSGTIVSLMFRKVSTHVRAPSELVPGLPPDLDRLCVALLQLDATRRPGAEEILRVLTSPERGRG